MSGHSPLYRFYCLFLVTLAFAGCKNDSSRPDSPLLNARTVQFKGQLFDVVSIDPDSFHIGLYWQNEAGAALKDFRGLKKYLKSTDRELLFATNAGIFSDDLTPGGLHVENGVERSPLNLNEGAGNFHMMPNGVFLLGNTGPKVLETDVYAELSDRVRFATQSGPLLVIRDKIHPTFNEGSGNKYVRSGVGVDANGVVHFAISQKPVNFFDFASLFKKKLLCPDALYLDGTISKFYLPQLGLDNTQSGDFVGMFGVTRVNR